MTKALGLLSGGLDSSLAALTLKRQGLQVTCVSFVTPFFGSAKAEKAAEQMKISLLLRDIGEIHLEMVKNPRYGYGKNMNPCIDCHAMMFRLAGEIMAKEGYDFLFSGEVLGQRPMSQNPNALRSVANYSGHPDRILRPLCAKLLPVTPMEEQGLVDRERLLDIQGRSRKRQGKLALEWGFIDYPASGGGCLLTEKSFSGRLRDLFRHQPECSVREVKLLKAGRQFRLSPRAKLTLGRNQEDNRIIESLASTEDILLDAADLPGPLGMVGGKPEVSDLEAAGAVVAAYGKGQDRAEVEIDLNRGGERWRIRVRPMAREDSRKLIVD